MFQVQFREYLQGTGTTAKPGETSFVAGLKDGSGCSAPAPSPAAVQPPAKPSQALHHRSSSRSGGHRAPPVAGIPHHAPCSELRLGVEAKKTLCLCTPVHSPLLTLAHAYLVCTEKPPPGPFTLAHTLCIASAASPSSIPFTGLYTVPAQQNPHCKQGEEGLLWLFILQVKTQGSFLHFHRKFLPAVPWTKDKV